MMYRYKYPERFNGVEMPDFKRLSNNIILFGAGLYGDIAAALIRNKGYDFICFCDNDINKQGISHNGYDVLSPEQCRKRYTGAAVIITVHSFISIYKQLIDLGYTDIYSCVSLFLEFDISVVEPILLNYKDIRQLDSMIYTYLRRVGNAIGVIESWGGNNKGIYMPQIDISTTERCTLRCKECTSLMPYYKNPKDADWVNLEKSINRLLSTVENCLYFLEGGEVFLYPHLSELISLLAEHPNTDNVWIITNGTLLPEQKVVEALKHPKCLVRISDYGKHSVKMIELKSLCEDNNIPVIIHGARWTRMSAIRDYNRSAEQNQELMDNCCKCTDGALFLLHDRLYKCPFAGNAERLGAIPRADGDSVDLLQEPYLSDSLRKQIDTLIKRGSYINACRYCNGRVSSGLLSDVVPPAEQLVGSPPPLLNVN